MAKKTQKNLALKTLDGNIITIPNDILNEMAKQLQSDFYKKPEQPIYCTINPQLWKGNEEDIQHNIHPSTQQKKKQLPHWHNT